MVYEELVVIEKMRKKIRVGGRGRGRLVRVVVNE